MCLCSSARDHHRAPTVIRAHRLARGEDFEKSRNANRIRRIDRWPSTDAQEFRGWVLAPGMLLGTPELGLEITELVAATVVLHSSSLLADFDEARLIIETFIFKKGEGLTYNLFSSSFCLCIQISHINIIFYNIFFLTIRLLREKKKIIILFPLEQTHLFNSAKTVRSKILTCSNAVVIY